MSEQLRGQPVEKKQLIIFILAAYGVTFVLGLLMWAFYGRGADLSVFPNARARRVVITFTVAPG